MSVNIFVNSLVITYYTHICSLAQFSLIKKIVIFRKKLITIIQRIVSTKCRDGGL